MAYPTVGRVVHYRTLKGVEEPLAALIVGVEGVESDHGHKHECSESCGKVMLCAFVPKDTALLWLPNIPFSASAKPGHWSWPPKV